MTDEPVDDSQMDASASGGAAIAIVGMSGRFPGARGVRQLWRNLRDGVESFHRFAPDELEDAFSDDVRNSPEFVPVRPMLEDVDQFDADFFNMHAREAALTDPQQRVFLECCWEALEDAGHDPAKFEGAIGVFAGSAYNSYLIKHVFQDRGAVEEFTSNYQVGSYQEFVASLQDFVATRVAYKLDLKGPAVNVQSACSTSLLAVAEACKSLLLYQADMALAGGVSITFPQKRGYVSLEGGMVSPEGRCRPYDADASGTVFGSGAGVVVLKRLDDALADGDTIYAVVRGFGVNNDGAQKVGFTAPSVDGQAAAIASALAMAGVEADAIGYIEGHGTATPLGDPIEFKGLEKAFRASTDKRNYCVLGSSKANFGHLDVAAGIAGLIKASLVLEREEIPPLINFKKPNPNIDVAASPFKFVTALTSWPRNATPRMAGVSSFGVGGTNVHIVLEEAPRTHRKPAHGAGPHVLPLAARTPDALARMTAALADRIEADPALDLRDVAHTLQVGRRAFDHRAAVVAADASEAVAKLRAADPSKARAKANAPKVVFMFPGQGAQYPGMGKALYDAEPVFREHVDRGAAVLEPLIDADLRTLLFADIPADDETPHPIRSTVMAQPALFVVEHAMAQLLMSRGIEPAAMIGHSVGEFVAACLAGVLSFEDALKLVAARGRLMQDQQPGAMLSVRTGEARLVDLLVDGVDVAAINAPNLSVASGPFEAVAKLEARLDAEGIAHRRLHTSHAFHSAMMDGVVEGLKGVTRDMPLSAPTRPYVSSVSGQWVRAEDATSADYWARHCRQTVRFADALATLLKDGDVVLVEVGPGRTLSTFAGQAKNKANVRVALPTLPEFANRGEDRATFAATLAGLWCEGVAIDFAGLRVPGGRRVPLPTYAFSRKRHWIEAPKPDRGDGVCAEPEQIFEQVIVPLQQPAFAAAPQVVESPPSQPIETEPSMSDRISQLHGRVRGLLEELSGESLDGASMSASFLELGFDSLFLGQFAQRLQKVFGAKITFRQLMREYPSIEALSAHLLTAAKPESLPQPAKAAPAPVTAGIPARSSNTSNAPRIESRQERAGTPAVPGPAPLAMPSVNATGIEGILQSQLVAMQQLITQQLQVLQGVAAAPQAVARMPQAAAPAPQVAAPAPQPTPAATEAEEAPAPSRFAMYKPGQKSTLDEITPEKKRFIDELTARFNKKAAGSKARTQAFRDVLADPRTANGFRAEWKEVVHPIVAAKSKGSKIWDVDGNEYVDLVNGFGQTMFGHAPDFVVDAVSKQLHEGFSIGPQSPLAYEVARMFAEMTGTERVTFCNTGSEAVMAAMRVARAVTGRDTIVMFSGDYHGQFDEVLVKPTASKAKPGALPIAPGIPRDSVANVVVLPYGAPESIAWVREHKDDIAAVVAETVQSRHPDLRPREFLVEMRKITEECGAALVFDEVVTGFRVHPGGMQAVFGIKADMATYGKVVGGGMPVGVLAGKAQFMDALDGGFWKYGDDSVPEVAPTFFAGTFVRHPLVLAACRACLVHMKAKGPALQDALAEKTKRMVGEMNAHLAARGVKTRLESYASWTYANFAAEDPMASLLHPYLRSLGVHVIEGFPWYLTTAHSDADIKKVVDAFKKAIDALQGAGILAPQDGPEKPTPGPNGSGPKPGKAKDIVLPAAATLTATPARAMNGAAHASGDIEVPLTEEQREVWLAAQLSDGASCAYNEGSTLTLEGDLKPALLIAALNDVVARHDALRASVSPLGDNLRIARALKIDVPLVDLSGATDADARFKAIMDEEARTPFDLAKGPLVRARLVRRAADRHALVFTAHHIVCDGWSSGVVMQETGVFYQSRLEGKAADLPPALSFAHYAAERNATKTDDAAVEQYWLGEYKDLPPPLELPSDRARPNVKTFRGATHTEQLDAALINAVKKAGSRHGTTLFATLFAATQVVLGKLGGETDIALTVPMAGQTSVEDKVLVGHCVNFLPVRARFEAAQSFGKHLEVVKDKVFAALDHQNYTYGTLVSRLGLKRDPNRTPITDVQFNHEKFGEGVVFPGLKASVLTNPKAFVVFDLFFNMTESDAGVRVDVDYSTDLYDEATIKRWVGHLRSLLQALAQDTSRAIGELSILSDEERRWLIADLNATRMDYPKDALVHELIEAQAARTPDAVALKLDDATLTYRELNERVAGMAARFSSLLPEGGKRIAVALPRSLELIVALIAVLKSGNAYVPLDSTHPAARLTQTLEAADVSALVCAEDDIAALVPAGAHLVRLDHPAAIVEVAEIKRPREGASAAAYVIFTSGSTGTPKGVEIEHRAVVNFLLSMAKEPGFTAKDSIVTVTTVSFDIAGLEMYLPLITGGTALIVSRQQVKDGFALVDVINKSGATVLQATPSLWRMLVEAGLKLGPKLKMLCGGEPLPRDLANRLLEGGGELWNVYGPTETTIWSSAGRVEAGAGAITIGAPIANTEIHILDAGDRLAAVGAVGDVYIGGDGLARGYFNRPDLTAAAFRTIDLGDGVARRLYRTGDVGRRLVNGAIQLQGRKDQQIKLRGYRIELEDIEVHLRRAPGVGDAAVAVQGAGESDARLVGYYVAANGADIPHKTLARHLSEHVPDYMVPTLWQRLDAMPQTANGKLNRKALPPVRVGRQLKVVAETAAPQLTASEERIARVWRELLEKDDITADTHFFEAGGHSLLAMRLITRLQTDLNRPVTIADLFRAPKLGDFAKAVAATTKDEATAKIVRMQSAGSRQPLIVLNNAWSLFPLAKILGPDQPIVSIQFVDRTIEEPKPATAFDAIVDDAVSLIRRAQPQGPYLLAGHCILGAVVLEAARRLKGVGEKVELVAMLDTEPNGIFRGIPLRTRLYNYVAFEIRKLRWGLGLWLDGDVNGLYVIGRYKWAHRMGLLKLAERFGRKERWFEEDFHTQHVVDAWGEHTSRPYDGDVVLYRADPHERKGFLERWIPWAPNWKSIIGDRLTVEYVKVEHSEMFRDNGSELIGRHLSQVLDALEQRRHSERPSESGNTPGSRQAGAEAA